MTSRLATLRLAPAVHTHDVMDGRVGRHPRSHFLEFIIDGVSLRRTAHGEGNLVTELNRSWWSQDPSVVETLLGRRPAPYLESGRIPLLVCGECGDLACGAVTAALDMGPNEVTWSDFRWENGYEEPEPIDSLSEPIRFDRGQYEAELADVDDRVAALPENEPLFRERSRRGRQFRWPWQRNDGPMLKRERDPELDPFDHGCLVLRRDGETAGHVATTLGTFWSPSRARTVQQWVWLVVVWADGKKEMAVEDYPPWTYVREIWDGLFVWPGRGPRSGEYTVEWVPHDEREAKWAELGITLDDF